MEELKKYFQEHQDKFRKQQSVTISEIFLSSAGKNEAEVKARALELVRQLRAGAHFAKVAGANSEREQNGVGVAPPTDGKEGTFEVPNLRAEIADAVKSVPVGGISKPLKFNDRYQIFPIDERA